MDHRTVPLEVLREFARSQAELSSIRLVAEDAGVGRSTVHAFISKETMPHPRVRRRLALWYLRRREGVDEFELVRPYVSALKVLLAQVPEHLLQYVTMSVLESISGGLAEGGEEEPGWIRVLQRRTGEDRDNPNNGKG